MEHAQQLSIIDQAWSQINAWGQVPKEEPLFLLERFQSNMISMKNYWQEKNTYIAPWRQLLNAEFCRVQLNFLIRTDPTIPRENGMKVVL